MPCTENQMPLFILQIVAFLSWEKTSMRINWWRSAPAAWAATEQFIAVGICAIFSREQFLFQHLTKKKHDISVFRTVFA